MTLQRMPKPTKDIHPIFLKFDGKKFADFNYVSCMKYDNLICKLYEISYKLICMKFLYFLELLEFFVSLIYFFYYWYNDSS
jgi:hypothetical protein